MIVIIAGDGPDLERELEEAEGLFTPSLRIAVNNARRRMGDRAVHLVATLHPDRVALPGCWGPLLVSPVEHPRVHVLWSSVRCTCGGSGMYATLFALGRQKASRVVLCGMPMDTGPYLEAFEADHCWEERASSDFKGRVRSMSGRTRELLGAPDAKWLECS